MNFKIKPAREPVEKINQILNLNNICLLVLSLTNEYNSYTFRDIAELKLQHYVNKKNAYSQ